MHVIKLQLKNYRNFPLKQMDFTNGINIIYGSNAKGKTNIIESIYLASTGRSHRTRLDKQLILFDEKTSNVKVSYLKNGFVDEIEVFLKIDEKKGIALNKTPIKKIGELFGELQTVIFSPYDLSIINDSPADRRKFMDIQICQVNKIYYYHLHTYYKILKQRNALLKKKAGKDNLFVWDAQLIDHGKRIIDMRDWFVKEIAGAAKNIHMTLTDNADDLDIVYRPSATSENFENKLLKNYDKDMLFGSTTIGPHKDDLSFFINGRDAKSYGSQGQKRTVILSVKLAEVIFVKNETGDTPVLLLDDALSELDKQRQQMLVNYIKDIQVIITGTGMEDIISSLKEEAKIFYIEDSL